MPITATAMRLATPSGVALHKDIKANVWNCINLRDVIVVDDDDDDDAEESERKREEIKQKKEGKKE